MSLPPDPTCNECDSELVDLDMAEDFDDPTIRWSVGRCPECEPLADCPTDASAITHPKATQ